MPNLGRTEIRAWFARNKRLTAFLAIVILGYAIGKDLALRDNVRDAKGASINLHG